MDFVNKIDKETLIICNKSDKINFLKRDKLINIKVIDMNEFVSKYCFSYDEDTVLYVMDKYCVKYDIALVYIKNLYYIDDCKYGVKKLDFLVELKRDLDKNKLLRYNEDFREYVKNVDLVVYGIRLGKYELNLFKNLDYKYIDKELKSYKHTVYYFDTMEEEVEYVAVEICKLIDSGIKTSQIKLANIDSSYYNTITRIFSLFGLRANIINSSSLMSFSYVKEFLKCYLENDLDYAVSQLDKDNVLYDKLINTINQYIKYDNKDLIIYKLKKTYVKSDVYNNGIEIIDYLDCVNDDNFVFMLGFNDGIIPNSYKDIDYITDNIKEYVNLDDTTTKNINLREDILSSIYNVKNLCITYKLKDTKRTFYPSSLVGQFDVCKGEVKNDVSYSEVYNKIKLTRSIDDYIKYGYKSNEFDLLYNNFSVNYNSFDNRYNLINRVMDKLTLSYSKMQIYNKCAFRYYLTDILKLDIFEENFSTVIGSMVHYVMEKCLSHGDMDTDKYVLEFLGDRTLSKKEQFFLEKYKLCIKELMEQIKLEKEYGLFDCAMYEKKIDIDYGNNVKFTGIIDKILYKEENDKTYVALVDYKTGNDDISLKYLNYGINVQLPIYLYLSNYLNFRNVLYSGFYLQKFNIIDKDYRLVGYSNSDKEILSIIDNNYDNSKIIKGLKTLKDGSFSSHSKVLDNSQINLIKDIVGVKIEEVIDKIRNNDFTINPKIDGDKNIGCDFCKFRDICFVNKKNYVAIEAEEFGGE